MITKHTWISGARMGIDTTWTLGKIIFPITLIITLLQYTPVIDWVVALFSPLMHLFGLPGDAAIVLALGNVLNLYAAIGAMLTMDLTVKQVFILSVMLSFSHALIVETAIARKIGVKGWIMASTRLALAFLSAWIIHHVWSGGQELAKYGIIAPQENQLEGWGEILLHGFKTSSLGILQMAIIVIPLMVGIQILKDMKALPFLAKGLTPFTRLIGVTDKTGVTLMAGIVFGISFGAGVIIQAAKEDNLSKKDLYLVSTFLVVCHAVIEDTLLFVPLGINVFPLLLIRVFLAILITAITAKIWTHLENKADIPPSRNYLPKG